MILHVIPTINYYVLPETSKIHPLESKTTLLFNDQLLINHLDLRYYSCRVNLVNSYISDISEVPADELLEITDNVDLKSNFLFLRHSTINAFFTSNMVDLPTCFKKSKSLYSKTFEIPLLKFVNLIMRHGLRERALKATTLSFTRCFLTTKASEGNNNLQWVFLYNFLMQTTWAPNSGFTNFSNKGFLRLDLQHTVKKFEQSFNHQVGLKNLLFDSLYSYAPAFSFYIKKVSKTLRKNSRGKSGKYMLVWKYVPVYKRLFLTMKWLLKTLRFQRSRGFQERLHRIIEDFLLKPDSTLVSKLRRFVHKFVFSKYRNTLLKTLKSV